MTDPISGALTQLGASAVGYVAEEGRGFLARIAGGAADEFGKMFAERVRLMRYGQSLKLAARAAEMVRQSGGNPKEVPVGTLLPLLEKASLEDDPKLFEMWAALLANTALGTVERPKLAYILEQLTPLDAHVLSLLPKQTLPPHSFRPVQSQQTRPMHPHVSPGLSGFAGPTPGELAEQINEKLGLSLSSEVVRASCDALVALGLTQRNVSRTIITVREDVFPVLDGHTVTDLGLQLRIACMPPNGMPVQEIA
ncbi:MAG TPA: hypothetical protein VGC13_24950 [Longimicrobium sp.]|jgi:hypothetical protein|uniref:Abi-alpha family protein n=1 Tax=Longimicrobium sp. TaxID=2029185 RepID=UPI002EDB8460